MEKKSYLPAIWSDDLQMAGLMAMNKARAINPYDFDRKIKFWTEVIGKSCEEEKDCTISLERLKKRFRRGDQIPGCLEDTISSMIKDGELMRLEDFKGRDQSWVQWGYSRIIGTFWGGESRQTVEYVHLPTIRKQAKNIIEFYHSDFIGEEDDMSNEIVGLNEFRARCSHLVADDRVFQLIIMELVHQGELTIGLSKVGEKVLKFRNGSIRGPIQWTESDAGLHDMRRAMSKLEREIKRLEEKAKIAEENARLCIRKGERNKAAHHLRQKKRALSEMNAKDVQYQKLLDMLYQLGQTRQNKQIIDAYKAGADAFKATLHRQGIDPNKIDETMDSIHDAMVTAEEIHEAISSGVPSNSNLDKELEAELNSILADSGSSNSLLNGLPEVPSDEPEIFENEFVSETLARRLRKLRETS
ncbi:unnamed protein product [Dracunculus medinensis]|uniref:Charged multivesicular body protein 7 n=1 Tax=Dracunculus medinensis TaxID=318479 RepID=A0A0N4UBN9_DRAME|nr:unnamed protein product [Dracunculus medinensis]